MPRGLRKAVLPLRKGDDPVYMRRGKLLTCVWHDIKCLTMLTSIHGNACVVKRIRTRHTEHGYRDINRPHCVNEYNMYMGGVDTADQRMKTYLFPHRARKWYSRIYNAILSMCVVNAHIIYCRSTAGPRKPLKGFVQEIITCLLEGYTRRESTPGRKRTEGGEMPQRLTERHWLRECVRPDWPDCTVCSDRNRPKGRVQTGYRCKQCGVGLCPVPCMERYHTVKVYKQCYLDRTLPPPSWKKTKKTLSWNQYLTVVERFQCSYEPEGCVV